MIYYIAILLVLILLWRDVQEERRFRRRQEALNVYIRYLIQLHEGQLHTRGK
jgi:hypothetical protein